MKKFLTLMVLGLWALHTVSAQDAEPVTAKGSVTGEILDAQDGQAMIGVSIMLKGTQRGAITNLQGVFTINSVAEGEATILIKYLGYADVEKTITVKGGEAADFGKIQMEPMEVGLKDVEVFAGVVEERRTPIAISTISAKELDERYGNVSLAEAMQNTPGVYTTQGAGGYGDQEVFIRGFDQTNVAFLINGVPINDMENGRMFWSNFAGLNQVTRTMQIQRGLGASKLAISSIGGTVNMITKPSDRKAGGRIEYMTGTGSWNNRLRFTYNTGQSDNGWAFSIQGTRTTTNSARNGLPALEQGPVRPGAYVDAWSYYASASKQINKKHQLMFWAFGAPFNRGSAWTADDQTVTDFRLQDNQFNNALGIKNGELFNARQNKVHKPMMAITHYWDIDANTDISTSVYYSFARVYSVQPRDAEAALFMPDRAAALSQGLVTSENLIDWDYIATQNRDASRQTTIAYPNGDPNTPSVTGYDSRYYLESRHNNHNWIGLVSNYTKQLRKVRIRGGIDVRRYRGEHYAEVYDLMGGDFIVNQNRFGDAYNKLDGPNAIARKGDKTNYHYDGVVNWGAAFGQAEAVLGKFIIFGSATFTLSDMQRIGYFWSGSEFADFEANSLGKSEKRNYATYILKTGVNYRFNNRSNVFVNAGHFTRPPFMRDAFDDARYSNKFRLGLDTEKIYSTEVGYSYNSPYIKANFNAYYLIWQDRTTQLNLNNPDQNETADIPLVLSGMVSRHMGLELDFVLKPTSNFELNGYVSVGDWTWADVPNQTIVIGSERIETDDAFAVNSVEGLPVGFAAQTTMGAGFHYSGIRSTYIGSRMNFADRIPVGYALEDVADGFITADVIRDEFDSYYTVDIYAGRYFKVGDSMSGRLSFAVNNLLDEQYVRWASFFNQQTQRAFGFPRTYTLGLSFNF